METYRLPGRAELVASRADQCRRALRRAPAWVRMTIGADAAGTVLLATTDQAALLRPGVGRAEGERVLDSAGHPELAIARALRGRDAVIASTGPIPAAVAGPLRGLNVAVVTAAPMPHRGPAPVLQHRLTGLGGEVCRTLGRLDGASREYALRLLIAVALASTPAGDALARTPRADQLLHRLEDLARRGDADAFAAARAVELTRCHAGAGPGGMADALYEAAYAFGGAGELLDVLREAVPV